MILNDLKVGFLIAFSTIRRGNKKTLGFVVFVLSLIFLNLVFLSAFIGGMSGIFTNMMQDYPFGDIVIEPTGENSYINNADNVLHKVRSVPGMRAATKRLDVGASISHKQKVVGAGITGLMPIEEESISRYPYIISEGEFLSDLSRDEIIIGAMIAGTGFGAEMYDDLGEVRAGEFVDVTFSNGVQRTYKVKGIMTGTLELVDLNAVLHYKEIEDVFGLDEGKATTIVARIDDAGTEDLMKVKIVNAGVKEQVFTWSDKSEALIKQAMQTIGGIDIVSKFISLIVGAALILIIIYINILNKKKEIGILKAVGITPMSIVISYAFISMLYVSLGIIVGLCLFFALIFYFQANPVALIENMVISPIVDYNQLFSSILIMLFMSVVAGIIPAWRVSKESILSAIWGR
jgi:putative ABC transport system permease protein